MANAVPGQSTGGIGSTTSNWYSQAYGGPAYTGTLPGGLVFSSTVNGPGISYSTPAVAGSAGVASYVEGTIPNPLGNYEYDGVDYNYSSYSDASSYSYTQTTLQLVGTSATWTTDGNALPVLPNANVDADGHLAASSVIGGVANSSLLTYNLTALTPVPLPASVWLLLSGLGVLGAVARRRRVGGVIAQAVSTGPSCA